MDPKLLAVGVCNSGRVSAGSRNAEDFIRMRRHVEPVEEELDEVGIFFNLRCGGHGQIEVVFTSEHGHSEGVGSFLSEHLIEGLDLGVNKRADVGQKILDDLGDDLL